MSKVTCVKLIVKAYFLAALIGSFTHIVTAAEKLGLTGWEAVIVPFLIDGMFIIAMVLRGEVYGTRTRTIGLRVQVAMGALSLTANITAAETAGGVILAGLLVGGMIFSEWLVDAKQMKTAAQEDAEAAVAEAERIAREDAEARAARKADGIRKAQATRRRKATTRKVQAQALEELLNA
jgi:hypothetical protein